MPYWPRLIVLLPILALLLAAFLDAIWQVWEQTTWLVIPAAIAALLVYGAIGNGNYRWYFLDYIPVTHLRFISAPMDIGNYLRADTSGAYAYGISTGNFYIGNEVTTFLAPKAKTCSVINGLDLSNCPDASITNAVFFIIPGSEGLIPALEKKVPGGTLSKLRTYDLGQSIWLYRVRK
jgi:hypothetical protein